MALSVESQKSLEAFRARLAASKERFAQGKELVKRDKDGKIIMPEKNKPNIFQAAFKDVEQTSASDS